MGDLQNRRQVGPTPYRQTSVILGESYTSLSDPGFAATRWMGEIKPQIPGSHGCEQLASGVWILSPVNADYRKALENVTTGEPLVFGTLRLAAFNHAGVIEEVAYWRTPSELSGIGTGANVATQGDYWFKKRVSASGGWASSIPVSQNPLIVSSNWPLDRVLEQADNTYGAYEAGYLLRFSLDSRKEEHLDTLFVFYFGGEVDATGRGQFALQVAGSGVATLWEIDSDGAWHQRDSWQFCPQSDMPVKQHAIRVIPHAFKWIEFLHETTELVGGFAGMLSINGSNSLVKHSSGRHLYTIRVPDERPDYTKFVTNPGPIYLDVARLVRLRFQIGRVLYPLGFDNAGVILDGGIDGGYNLDPAHLWLTTLHGYTWTQSGADLTHVSRSVLSALDGSTLALTNETYTDVDGTSVTATGHEPVGAGANPVQMKLTLYTDDSRYTPYLYGYSLRRNPGRITVTDTQETLAGSDVVREVSVLGADADPSHESANVQVIDHTGKVNTLKQHADTGIVVRVGYDKTDLTKTFNAFRGYFTQADRERRHAKSAGAFAGYAAYDVTAAGMWRRIFEKWLFEIPNEGKGFLTDPNAPPIGGENQCYSYAYILQWMLRYCGFADDEIRVDANFSQLRPVPAADKNGIELARPLAQTPVGEYVNYVMTNHVGGYLLWDNNAGQTAAGAWRLRMFPEWNDTPIFHFVTTPGIATGKLRHRLESYAANTAPVSRRGYREFIVPPEGNILYVVGAAGESDPNTGKLKHTGWWVNEKSVQIPGLAAPDPTDPDYIGRAKRLLWFDPYLTNDAVLSYVGNRVAETAMRGYRMRTFTSHYVLVDAGNDLDYYGNRIYPSGTKRPLQFGDVVTIDGTPHMIRRVSPAWRHDTLQYAKYEAQELRAPLWTSGVGVRVGSHSVGASRAAHAGHAQWHGGFVTACPHLFRLQKDHNQAADQILALPSLVSSYANVSRAGLTSFSADFSVIDGTDAIR